MKVASIPMAAVQPEFEIEIGPHGEGELAVLEVTATEELSRAYEVQVTVVARGGVSVDPRSVLGKDAVLLVHLGTVETRYLHGVVASFDHWEVETGLDRRRYKVTIAPRLWKLRHRVRSRIFQAETAPQIVKKVLDEAGVESEFALSTRCARRDFCVQYRESDFAFVSRLLEEEGIFYWFKHREDGHVMVLADSAPSCPKLSRGNPIAYRERSGMVADEHIDSFLFHREVRPTAVTLRDFNYLRPTADLTVATSENDNPLEVYEYPGRYVVNVGDDGRNDGNATGYAHAVREVSDEEAGKARARTRLEELRVAAETASGTSTSRQLEPGRLFELTGHPADDFDGEYLILSVKHHVWQPEVLEQGLQPLEAPERPRYRNEFVCLRKGVAFRPERKTPRPTIAGPQTAMVVGLASEEIDTDAHGRVKVQFHWDREGKRNESSSPWIRVSQAWAGPRWGALFLPRIGHEVVVEFTDGNPDRPLITGSVYNGENRPPITLPSDKTQSTLRSASSPGGEGSNELRFEDEAGKEKVTFHAEKDLKIVVENDKTQHVGGNETLTVDKDRSRTVIGNQTLLVERDDTSTIHLNQSLEVGMNRNVFVGGTHTETVFGDQVVSVGKSSQVTVTQTKEETVGLAKTFHVGEIYRVKVGAAMSEVVGEQKTEDVLGDKRETIGGNKKETVFGSRELDVTGNLTENVTQSRELIVGTGLAVNAETMHHHATEKYTLESKEIVLSATEQFTLDVGKARITVTAEGDLVIEGVKVALNAVGVLLLKGASVSAGPGG
jgi:type VI secretion system secreted protein VgrG